MHYSLKLSQAIGKVAQLRVDKLSVDVIVRDTREVWGRVDCLVSPLSGRGEQWISFDRLSPIPEPDKTACEAMHFRSALEFPNA